MDRLSQIIAYVREQPWAIQPRYLSVMRDIIRFGNTGAKLTEAEIQDRIAAGKKSSEELYAEQERMESAGGSQIAVIPIFGVISQHAHMVNDISGPQGTSTQVTGERFQRAVDNPDVKSIVLNIHSPGGGVYGVEELASKIRAARGKKPITAVANSLAASAAYWIASAANELVVTPGGEVGSIGVFTAHEDLSEALTMEGVKITLVHAGKHKVESNPFEPLSDEAKARLQSEVDQYYRMFVDAVAKGRGVSTAAVRKGFGEGRTATAKEALGFGMVDRIATLEDTMARAGAGRGRKRAEDETATIKGMEFAATTTTTVLESDGVLYGAEPDPELEPVEPEEIVGESEEKEEEEPKPVAEEETNEDEQREWNVRINRWKQNGLDNE